MALDVLLLAVRDRLREKLNGQVESANIEVTFDGRPFGMATETFVAIHEGEWQPDGTIANSDECLPERFGVQVTVTMRCGFAPFDRIGTEVLADASRGLLMICRLVLVALHMRYEVLHAANDRLAENVNGFFHPLVFADGGMTTPRGPQWFQAKTRSMKQDPPAGLSRTLSFRDAQRVQTIESAV